MSGYWNNVPRGIWTIIDAEDAIEALNDEESRWILDRQTERVYITGPIKKGLIVDIKEIRKSLSADDFMNFIHEIEDVLGELLYV